MLKRQVASHGTGDAVAHGSASSSRFRAGVCATMWSKIVGGTDAVAADRDFVFAGDASDRITAWKANGDVAWTSDKLLYRSLSAPLSVGKTVVFGDADGVLHFLARDSGEALLRLSTDGSPIVAQPVVSGTVMLAVTRNGGLFAFRPQ